MQDVVITGYGIISPLGNTIEEFSRRMFAGDSGVVNIRGKNVPQTFPIPYAAIVDSTNLKAPALIADLMPKEFSRFAMFAGLATEQAINQLPKSAPIDAIVYGTAEGMSYESIADTFNGFNEAAFDWRHASSETSLEILKALIQRSGLGQVADADTISINSACASGNQAIGLAYQNIRAGKWTRCIAGGVDARVVPSNLMNFNMLGALSTADRPPHAASRPFSVDRAGFVRGEGAATLVLETRAAAEARGAKILGRVLGYGLTSDAYRLTDGREDASSTSQAMRLAIQTAGLSPTDIDYVNAHGTSTKMNDAQETLGIKTVLGEHAYKTPVSSLKSQLGHSTVAAGAMEAIACLLMLEQQRLAPTINFTPGDPDCDLDYVPNVSRAALVRHILSNNFGFGGQNACIVLGQASAG